MELKMNNFIFFIYFIVVNLFYFNLEASHFRGGIITWKHIGNQQLEIKYRVSFRRSYSSSHYCDQNTKLSNSIVSGEGALSCISGCIDTIANPMSYTCTDFSENEDWTTGERTVIYTYTSDSSNKVIQFGYASCCWISTLVVGRDSYWIMRTTADLSVRQDTGKINTSPISAMQPIVRFKHGCSYTLKIPAIDPDGDTVKCRWATNDHQNECYSVCKALENSVLDENLCTLSYTASYKTGWHAVALQIEDYANPGDTQPLSSVPLQFLIDVFTSSDSCDEKPIVSNLTDIKISIAVVKVNTTFFQTIIADSGTPSVEITEIITQSPIGMIKSDLESYGTSGSQWHVNVTWTPSQTQIGSHVFCYTAVNGFGQSSDVACITIEVDSDDCVNVVCHNNGSCVDGVHTYTCDCPASHSGVFCESDIDFCFGVICQNGGSCVDGLYDYTCECPQSHQGRNCENDKDFCNGVMCHNDGSCIDGLYDYTCSCQVSHTGDHCETDIDFCFGVTCHNGGYCVDNLLNYTCECPSSHIGLHCEIDVDLCNGVICQNNGSCVDGLFDYICSCPSSHTGYNCETDIDFCSLVTCENGGSCVDGLFNYTCVCPESHNGRKCETDIDFCDGVVCQNDGSCIDGLYDYTCSCPASHTGDHCETDIDFCKEVLCQNEGLCIDGLYDYTCSCPVSHTGHHCETDIDFCEGVTCENGGTCVDVVITYNCTCLASHTGRHCEIDIDFCEDVNCYNGGTCVDGLFDYYCTCPLTHEGDHCETESSDLGYIVSVISVSVALITCGAITVFGLVKYMKPTTPKIGSNANSTLYGETWPNSDIPFVNMDSGHAYG